MHPINQSNINECKFGYLSHGRKHVIFSICNNAKYVLRCSRSSRSGNREALNTYSSFSKMVFEKLLGTDTYSTVLGESWCTLKLNRTTMKALNEELQGLTNVFVECTFVRIELNAHFSDAVNSFAEAKGSSANAYFRFSAEIKPKSGVITQSDFISEGNSAKKKISTYQLQQRLKLSEHKVDRISKYDPAKLFFLSKEHIKKELHNLSDDPQNNLKIFLSANNGRVKLAKDALTIFKSESESKFEDIIDHLANVLSNKRSQALLKQIYNIQAMDDFDIEGLVRMNFSKFVHDDRFFSMLSAKKMAADLELCGCKKVFGPIGPLGIDTLARLKQVAVNIQEGSDIDSLSDRERILILRRFMVSKTAKDLSIVITTIYPSKKSSIDDMNEIHNLPFDIRVVDTDFKPITKFDEWVQKDIDIMKANSIPINQQEE